MTHKHLQLGRRAGAAGKIRNVVAAAAIVLAAGTPSSSAFGESLTVSNTAGPVHTSAATEQGAVYEISASGVVSDWSDHQDGVDAVYCYGQWRCAQPEAWNQLRIDGKGMTEIAGHDIPYNGGHSYSVEFTGDGAPIEFYMSDAMSSAGDNSGAIQVTVTKLRDAPPGGNGNGNGGDTGEEEMPQLQAQIICDPDPLVITISELPSRTCTIWISHWKRNTAEPVQVLLPNAVDGFGNHANGIQIFGGNQMGSSSGVAPSNMSGYAGPDGRYGWAYPWGIFVFACPGQPGTGANCYGSVTAPGAFSGPFLVRQKGALQTQVMLLGTALPALPTRGPGGANPPVVTPPPGVFVRIHNRWKTDQFLHIEHGVIESGPIQAAWWSAQWTIEPVPGTTFVRIHNRWKPDQFLHIEHGVIESGPIQAAWWSAMWQIEPVPGTSYVRFQNHWKPDQYLHIEHGAIESGQILPAWWSAMWTIEP